MNDEQQMALAGTGATAVSLFGMLANHLASRGLVDTQALAAELRGAISEATAAGATPDRYDLRLIEMAAAWFDNSSRGWEPTVIPGGKPDPESSN